jgi:urea carboxylase-associated protein 1
MSSGGDALLTITADTCGRHDTLGGACSRESNTMRYALDKEYMHACRDSFIQGVHAMNDFVDAEACGCAGDLGKRDITCNINFFMNVPVTPEGKLTFEDGVSAAGRYVEMKAERDVVCVISNCPQLNNPCNAYNPTPVKVLVWDE